MSECVVRMEMPKRCKKCKIPLCLWVNDGWDVDDTIPAVQDFRKQNNDGFPDFCPIICQLPEGHGRLGDLDELAAGCDSPYWCRWLSEIEDAPTIVPAEAERKVDAPDAVAPTDTPTDTPTVPAERSET